MDGKKEIVCVTGATGYIGSWVIKKLLEQGYDVNATVRDKSKTEKIAHLTSLPNAAEKLAFFNADLLGPQGSFDEAIAGCDYVMHVASPYKFTVKDPQKELVDPALHGTMSVLRSCAKVGGSTLKKVIVTSSIAAIADEGSNGKLLTEKNWNTTSTLSRIPYYYSKTVAEKAVWDFVKDEKPSFEVCVINPSGVLGPSLNGKVGETAQSFIIAQVKEGQFPVVVDLKPALVDVRDVADAHVKAITAGKNGQRYICSSENVHLKDFCKYIRNLGYTKENGYTTPAMDGTGWFFSAAIRLASYTMGGVGTFTRLQLGNPVLFDTSKIKAELGIDFMPWEDTVKDTLNDLVSSGHLKAVSA